MTNSQREAECLDFMAGLPSPFAKVLNTIAISLTDANLSSLKLLLIADEIFKKSVLDKCKNAPDLFVQLFHSGYFSVKRLEYLSTLLTEIHRKDLARDLQKFKASEDSKFLPENCSSVCCSKSKMKRPMEQEEKCFLSCEKKASKTSLDDEFEMASSQESISDEEKLQRCSNYQSSDDFKMDI